MTHLSTKENLLRIVDEIEIVAKELIENSIATKHQKLSSADHTQLVDLLISKDKDLKSTLLVAQEQAKIEQNIEKLRAEVEIQDQEIYQLQKKLKEAEQILQTALFQARQKLDSIQKANKRPIPSEDLIKFAHRISASNAICAPLTWTQGDLRRPYPNDVEMRLGFLGKADYASVNGGLQYQGNLNDIKTGSGAGDVPSAAPNQFSWQPSGELHMSMGNNSVPLDTRSHKDAADVEVMSTDSSSSSSSDSQ
ncbi:mediator of RNA polymerase II transcription subunit 4 [Culicoides brevitarsis]|uniref:mediator of RNA polymerase II transcription subunit 4 n=1 Tax=Culicoides brevitarsis TaxID=469753 RepID=UPI00307BA73F